jgi:trans-aconitate methyltransferase
MNDNDRRALVSRYEERLARYGSRPEALGWSRPELQRRRFAALSGPIFEHGSGSVLDIGCGFADLHDYLHAGGWDGTYTGVDVVPGLLEKARERHPDLDLRHLDFSEGAQGLPTHDFVVASGVFNGRLSKEDHAAYVLRTLRLMFDRARVAVCVDFLSTWVNYQKPENWHADPEETLRSARTLSRRIVVRHDYLPFEFALYVYRDDRVGQGSTFESLP